MHELDRGRALAARVHDEQARGDEVVDDPLYAGPDLAELAGLDDRARALGRDQVLEDRAHDALIRGRVGGQHGVGVGRECAGDAAHREVRVAR